MTVPGPPVLHLADAAEAALALRTDLGVRRDESLPCVLTAAEEHAGLDVVVTPLPAGLSGFYLPRGRKRGLIAVNSSHAVVRQRFTIAHELGHHVLRHGAAPRVLALAETPSAVESPVGPSIGEGAAPRGGAEVDTHRPTVPPTAPVPETPTPTTDPKERAANVFAAELLCPVPAARAFVGAHAPSDEEGAPAVDFDLVVRLSCAFGLSAWAVMMRLRSAGILPDGEHRSALQARVHRSEHVPRYAELALRPLRDELQLIADVGIATRLPEGVSGNVVLLVTDPAPSAAPLPAPMRRLRRMLGIDDPATAADEPATDPDA